MIMEQLPKEAGTLRSPLSQEQRQDFLEKPFADLMQMKNRLAYREPIAAERLSVTDFVAQRFSAWRDLAERRSRDEQLPQEVWNDLLVLESKVLANIRQTYGESGLEWTYGLPKPDKFHQVDEQYYLTDFKLIAMRPEGYDFAVAVWADGLMPVLANTQLDTATAITEIRSRIQAWTTDWEVIAQRLGLPHDENKLRAMYAERIMGTIYADTIANRNLSPAEVSRRLMILKQLLEQFE